ncbi:MAG: HEAT repeat domain-containing protein [Ignavibacteriales bacterium]|nr:HEAT repeat domain-containing protein [Ignavibacteriales bacterium]
MKTKQILTTTLLIVSMAATAFATTPKSTEYKIDWQKAEKNYIVALSSDNIGLRHSATNYLGEYRLKGAVDHLITLLRSDKVENNRMAAALALMQIGEKEGVKAVEEASLFDGSEKVSRFCEQLINASSSKDLSMKN